MENKPDFWIPGTDCTWNETRRFRRGLPVVGKRVTGGVVVWEISNTKPVVSVDQLGKVESMYNTFASAGLRYCPFF